MGTKSKKSKSKKKTNAPDLPKTKGFNAASMAAFIASQEPTSSDAKLLEELYMLKTLSEQQAIMEKLLIRSGTDLKRNKNDAFGNGDQTPVSDVQKRAVLRKLWSHGGDFNEVMSGRALSPFASAVVRGEAKLVEEMLAKTEVASDERHRLLELRETGMRLSPMLLLIAIGAKNIMQGTYAYFIADMTGKPQHLEVAKILLKYGARPDSCDVTGKNACHYGAGCMATQLSMDIVALCMEAYPSDAYFGQKVQLYGLNSKKLNGIRGTCGGFLNGRRIIHLDEEGDSSDRTKRSVLIKPENIREAETLKDLNYDDLLLNKQDRLGSVSLHEVFSNDRVDVAEFLIKNGVDIDMVDYDGYSPRRWAEFNGQMPGRKCNMKLYKSMRKVENKARKAARCCGKCGRPEEKENSLFHCSRCRSVFYCNAGCQKSHWKDHKKMCMEVGAGIKLERPFKLEVSFGGSPCNYERPIKHAVGEKFWVKVQASVLHDEHPHLVYDESRQCQFIVTPGQKGFEELKEKIQAETVTFGKKSYFLASFDSAGDCTIYPSTAALKKF